MRTESQPVPKSTTSDPGRASDRTGSASYGPGAHIPALDTIRGIAILSVMLYHFNHAPQDAGGVGDIVFKLFRLGGSGVDLFFVLSGFLITGILIDAKRTPHYFRNFYIRRTLRIFPLYYGVLVVCCVLLPSLGIMVDSDATRHQGWLWFYGANILQAAKGSYVLGHFDHFWSLAVEEHFYLLWPLIIYACDRTKGMWACLACILIAIACRLALVLAGDRAVAAYVATPCRIDALAAGGLIAFAVRTVKGPGRLVPVAVAGLVGSCVLAAYLFAVKIDLARMDGTVLVLRGTLSTCFFGALLILAVSSPTGTLAGRCWDIGFLRFFGTYSYGLYVFHYPLIPLFDVVFPRDVLAARLGSVLMGHLAYCGLAIGISVSMAMLSWHLYEKHFLEFKDRLAPKRSDIISPSAEVAGGSRAEGRLIPHPGT